MAAGGQNRFPEKAAQESATSARRLTDRRLTVLTLLLHELPECSRSCRSTGGCCTAWDPREQRKPATARGRIHFAQFHRPSGHILRLIVGGARGDVLVHNQSPFFPVGDDVNAVRADRDGGVVEGDWNSGEKSQRTCLPAATLLPLRGSSLEVPAACCSER